MSVIDPHKIIKSLDENIVNEMLVMFFKDEEVMELGRGLQLRALSDSAITTGVDFILNKCTKPILIELEKGESYSTGGPTNEKSRSKPIIVENLAVKCAERGFASFLGQKKLATLEKVGEKLKVTGSNKEELIEKLIEEANIQGLTKMFEAFSPKTLKDWCQSMEIDIQSTSKKRLARGLIYGEDSGPTTTRKYTKPPVEKIKLDESISQADIMKCYTVTELKKFCGEKKIPALGTKDVLVDRIYRFLQGEEIDENEGKKPKKDKEGGDDEDKRDNLNARVEAMPSSSYSDVSDSGDDYNEDGPSGKSKSKKKPRKKPNNGKAKKKNSR
jgi:hypothetical protein